MDALLNIFAIILIVCFTAMLVMATLVMVRIFYRFLSEKE